MRSLDTGGSDEAMKKSWRSGCDEKRTSAELELGPSLMNWRRKGRSDFVLLTAAERSTDLKFDRNCMIDGWRLMS